MSDPFLKGTFKFIVRQIINSSEHLENFNVQLHMKAQC